MKVLIAVTHLLGSGHLSRALTLGRAFADQGYSVVVASGGVPVPHLNSDGIELVQLPALRSDGTNFTRLLTTDDQEADSSHYSARIHMLRRLTTEFAPDIVLTELFPFGRRVLSKEFETLLETARALPTRPVILSSVRDILAPPSKPAKANAAAELVNRFYDAVLVHSDPTTTLLDQSWPVTDSLRHRLRYTGYVAPPPIEPGKDAPGKGDVIVSAGGGPVGNAVFQTAIRSARAMSDKTWRILVGGSDRGGLIKMLNADAKGAPVIVEPVRPDFRQMLLHAAASVSLCGYNTALDVLQSGVPAVFVPFDDGGEVEQTLRASALAKLQSINVLASANLTDDRLCQAVSKVILDGRRAKDNLQFDGAAQSVAIATELRLTRS